MKALLWISGLVLVGAVLVTSVGAHHASGPLYDPEKRVEAVGTVTKFVFRNPHSFVSVDAANADGSTTAWEVELGTSAWMSRRGWTPETIKAGDQIRVVGQPSREPSTCRTRTGLRMCFGICCAELTKPDGSPLRP